MKLPDDIKKRFQRYGRTGGKVRARRMGAARRRSIARRAAIRRWTRARFGDPSFAALGFPGGEIVDAGLEDLTVRAVTVESLLVSIAAPRLRREGVPLPREVHADPEDRLYRLLVDTDGDLAHARYLACFRQAASFADACGEARRDRACRGR